MEQAKITFIGCGNMGNSLIGGLIKNGLPSEAISAADCNAEQRQNIEKQYGINTSEDNLLACRGADVIVLAVKPQVMIETIRPLAELVAKQGSLIISIAAGIPVSSLAAQLGTEAAIVRVMPNTPSLIQLGASGLYANALVSDQQKKLSEQIFNSVGISIWLDDESLIDSVTAVSGSGPAYFFLFIEAMQEAAVKLGLDQQQATLLSIQTALGAASMAQTSDESVSKLRQRVTSPGGTTEAALDHLENGNFKVLISEAIEAAHKRAKQLAEESARTS